jgi:hypothetical protein
MICGTACGSTSPLRASDESADSPPGTGDLLTCAGPPFSPTVFDAAANAEESAAPEGAALRAAIAGPPFDGSRTSGWRELGHSEVEAAFGTGNPPALDGYVVLKKSASDWVYAQSGSGCVVRPYRPGRSLARWGLDPGVPSPSEDAMTLQVIVNDDSCAGGVGPDQRLDPAVVDLTDQTVTITFTSRPPSGAQTCPSHPPAHRTVQLPQRLGNRKVLDGGIFPPQLPCRIENGDCLPAAQELSAKQ